MLPDAFCSDLICEHRTVPVPPIAHSLVAAVDAAVMEHVFDISKRQRNSNVQQHHPRTISGLVLKDSNEAGLVLAKR